MTAVLSPADFPDLLLPPAPDPTPCPLCGAPMRSRMAGTCPAPQCVSADIAADVAFELSHDF